MYPALGENDLIAGGGHPTTGLGVGVTFGAVELFVSFLISSFNFVDPSALISPTRTADAKASKNVCSV